MIPNTQLRKHLPPTWLTRLQNIRHKFRGVKLHSNTIIYFGAKGGLVALDKDTGKIIWEKSGTHTVRGDHSPEKYFGTIDGKPVTDENYVYFAGNKGSAFSLNKIDGTNNWQYLIEDKEIVRSNDGNGDYVLLESNKVPLPQGPFTLECWFKGKQFADRVGLLAKTEQSEYGIFTSRGQLDASVFLGKSYKSIRPDLKLKTNQWYHVAMVYEGEALALYLDGKLQKRVQTKQPMKRKVNWFPLLVGADPDARGRANSFFNGEIDEIRLSKGVGYRKSFVPERRLKPNENTVIFLDCDRTVGPFLVDRGPKGHYFRMTGDTHLVEVQDAASQ